MVLGPLRLVGAVAGVGVVAAEQPVRFSHAHPLFRPAVTAVRSSLGIRRITRTICTAYSTNDHRYMYMPQIRNAQPQAPIDPAPQRVPRAEQNERKAGHQGERRGLADVGHRQRRQSATAQQGQRRRQQPVADQQRDDEPPRHDSAAAPTRWARSPCRGDRRPGPAERPAATTGSASGRSCRRPSRRRR